MRSVIAAAILILVLSLSAIARSSNTPRSTLVQKVTGGEIDWGEQAFYAAGEALMPGEAEEPNRSKAYLKAKGNARTKAIANLLITIDAAAVNYAVTARQLMERDDLLRQTVEGLAHDAEIVSDRRRQEAGETVVEVTAGVPIYGDLGPGTVLLRALALQESLGQVSAQVKVETPKPSVKIEAPADQKGPFSALIVDARGFRLRKAMNPRIRRPEGSEVWGSLKPDRPLLSAGLASYSASLDEARRMACVGRNPLVVRAVGRAGGRILCDAVVATADAERILLEDKVSHFLGRQPVIFVVDPLTD